MAEDTDADDIDGADSDNIRGHRVEVANLNTPIITEARPDRIASLEVTLWEILLQTLCQPQRHDNIPIEPSIQQRVNAVDSPYQFYSNRIIGKSSPHWLRFHWSLMSRLGLLK